MLTRRECLTLLIAAALRTKDHPLRAAKVVRLYRSPESHPNALEATPEGLWVGEQVSDIAYLLDWRTGKVLRKVETESSNTSGMAYGGGYLWMAANGRAQRRSVRPADANSGTILKIEGSTGKTAARFPVPGGGGVHGLVWAKDSLWITSLARRSLTRMDAEGRVLHSIPVTLERAHGLGWDGRAIWCMFSNDRVIHRLDPNDGQVLEVVQLAASDPDPHGMTWYKTKLYYCDAGIGPGGRDNNSPHAGYICRIDIE